MLRIENLHFKYKNSPNAVIDGLSMQLDSGLVGILLGRNGCGKTTLFNNILGINRPSGGSVTYDGEDVLAMTRRKRACCIAYVPQNIKFGALTVYESIMMGRVPHFGLKEGENDRRVVRRIIDQMGLGDMANRMVTQLSGGERQKIAIARAMAQEPKIIIFDEPTGNLDMMNEELILREAKALASQGITILSSLHDINQALSFGDRFFFMKDGRIKYEGGRDIITENVIQDIYGAQRKVIEADGRKIVVGGLI